MNRWLAVGFALALLSACRPEDRLVYVIKRPPPIVEPAPPAPDFDTSLIRPCARPEPTIASAQEYTRVMDEALASIDECNSRLSKARRILK